MMIFREGNLGFSLRRVGICGNETAIEDSCAWLMMYSTADGPRVSYNDTV